MSSDGVADCAGGDWICGDVTCQHLNFARRSQCNKCHRDRSPERSNATAANSSSAGSTKKKLGTEIGKAAAEKSRGLFSAEDWQCSKCANVNWARRQTCNMCNAPKFCDVEERTGYGGGYNDRGVVEYKERSESDSEYDEFGRLKKRKKARNNKNNSEADRKQINDEDNVEEEDEDDDDDDDDEDGDDLSKYDLFAAPFIKSSSNNEGEIDDSSRALKDHGSTRRSRSQSHSRSSGSGSSSSSSSTSSSSSSTYSSTNSSSRSRSRSRNRSRSHSRSRSRSGKNSRRHRSSSRGGQSSTNSRLKTSLSSSNRHKGNISSSKSYSRPRSSSRSQSTSSSSVHHRKSRLDAECSTMASRR